MDIDEISNALRSALIAALNGDAHKDMPITPVRIEMTGVYVTFSAQRIVLLGNKEK